ncbi:ABC transporter transmembrane domain-containing protein [Streptomyces sp. MS1.HAVA.3]|uniref:ABC transporter transmembrane domain-containing protein n=1 Tax=Streptomyces caledonius TaxID=3134107 RepID=A0ABU8TZH0_9ACTN
MIAAEVALDAAAARLTGEVDGRSTARLRRLALARLLRTSPHHAARHAPGETAARLTAHATEAGKVPAAVAHAVAALLPPLGAVAALFLIDPWTAFAFLLGVPLLVLLLRAFARDTLTSVARYQQVQLATAGRLAEAMTGARTIAAAGTADRERARILAQLPSSAPRAGACGRSTAARRPGPRPSCRCSCTRSSPSPASGWRPGPSVSANSWPSCGTPPSRPASAP